MDTTAVYDAIVIGAGINGSCAALHLAKTGRKTVLVEQYPLPNSRGSSNGQSRFFRFANFSPDSFNPIVQDSYAQWLQLERESQTSLLRDMQCYFMENKSNTKELERLKKSLIVHDIKPAIQQAQDFNYEHKTTFDKDMVMLKDGAAKVLMGEKCLRTVQNLFVQNGGIILDEYPVKKISVPSGNVDPLVLIEGSKGDLMTKAVVVCAGPWTADILKTLGMNIPIKTLKVGVFYWPILDKSFKSFGFVDGGSRILKEHFYGLPELEYQGLVKIGYHWGVPCHPSLRDLNGLENIREGLKRYIQSNFPCLGTKSVIEESCVYTASPDKEMILDQHPVYKNISFGCGFSGTGFKTGPTVGKILAQLAIGTDPSFDISDFTMDRFDIDKSKL